jgi:UrcA family protein
LESFGRSSRAFHATGEAESHRGSTPQATRVAGDHRPTWETTMNTNTASTALRTRLLTATAIALLGGVLGSPAALAQPGTRTTVHVGDLNLASDAGARTLYARLRAAATVVCDSTSARDVRSKLQARECSRSAVAGAVAAVNHPAFSAWYAANVGGPAVPVAQVAQIAGR